MHVLNGYFKMATQEELIWSRYTLKHMLQYTWE